MEYVVSLVAVVAFIPVVLYVLIAFFAWRVPAPSPRGTRQRRVIVIIPAHNEESVIGGILSDLAHQEYPSDCLEVHVVADRCSDATIKRAEPLAIVHERSDGEETKGAAVAWLVSRLEIGGEDIVVVFDADGRIGPDVIGALSDGAESGFRVMQLYLAASNPDESYVSLAGALSQWMSNRLIDLPRRNLGMSCILLGTGFALVGDLAHRLTETDLGLTEDQALSDRFAIEGEVVVWLHHVHVLDEKPSSLGVLTRQRSRWAQGRSKGRRHALGALMAREGVWSQSRVDRILRLVLPGRTVSGAVLGIIAVGGMIWPEMLLFPPAPIFALLTAVVLVSVAALVAEGAGALRIAKIPVVALFALIWIPERVIARTSTSWYHTPHKGDDSG